MSPTTIHKLGFRNGTVQVTNLRFEKLHKHTRKKPEAKIRRQNRINFRNHAGRFRNSTIRRLQDNSQGRRGRMGRIARSFRLDSAACFRITDSKLFEFDHAVNLTIRSISFSVGNRSRTDGAARRQDMSRCANCT